MDDRTWFGLEDGDSLTPTQETFLTALRHQLGERLRPYAAGTDTQPLLLVLDVDVPDVALVSVGLLYDGHELVGDRVSIHDWSFPASPTAHGFTATGGPDELARRGAELLRWYASRPVVRHEWLHRRRVYATCYLFDDDGERLAQSYRGDWAPRRQQARLIRDGFVQGRGWIQTEGLGTPDRVVTIRG